jgi:ribosomal protein S18 acetylase RimI-like enzyme
VRVPIIRPYRPGDRAAVAEVCIRTGDSGGDASGKYADPHLLPAIYALPYVEHEPELAFVLDDDGTAVGYVLGTADTAAFVAWFRGEWLPAVEGRYPPPPQPPRTPDDGLAAALHHPERMLVAEVADHPAHLHIDLLPGYQGAGYGRALMGEFLRALRAAGVARVHLSMARANTGARAFYDRLGFRETAVPAVAGVAFLVRDTTAP